MPTRIDALLSQFANLTHVELPNNLQPLRKIQQAMDLISRATLPNMVAYKMSLLEHQELQRQVQGLLDKGYIQESLSPCAVPTLLTIKKDES